MVLGECWVTVALGGAGRSFGACGLVPVWRHWVLMLTSCVVLAACRGPAVAAAGVTTQPEVVIPEPVPAQEDEEKEAPLPPRFPVEPRATPPTAPRVGVAECDEFLAKYEHCIREVMSPDPQSGMLQAIDQIRELRPDRRGRRRIDAGDGLLLVG
jgi:hypothetical protein